MAVAGKVAITPKGEWNAETAYTKLDLVFYENASYVAIQPSTGVEPTNTSYWMLVVQSAGGADLDGIIDGSIQVGNAKTLDGHEAEYFATAVDLSNYLPKSGGTVENNTLSPFTINRSNINASQVALRFKLAGTTLAHIAAKSNGDLHVLNANEVDVGKLLHTGNKPTGTYTGNGDSTTRTISTGGIGNVVYVKAQYGFAIVTSGGYIAMFDGSVSHGTDAYVSNGDLKISSISTVLNASGVTYTYQVL